METKRIQVEEAKTQTQVNPENADQRILAGALARLGLNGEHWYRDGWISPCGQKRCIVSVISAEISESGNAGIDPIKHFGRAIGFTGPVAIGHWNDNPTTTFSDVSRAFEKAIELAAVSE